MSKQREKNKNKTKNLKSKERPKFVFFSYNALPQNTLVGFNLHHQTQISITNPNPKLDFENLDFLQTTTFALPPCQGLHVLSFFPTSGPTILVTMFIAYDTTTCTALYGPILNPLTPSLLLS